MSIIQYVLGLDLSTSQIGISILDKKTGEIVLLKAIDLNKVLKIKAKEAKTTTDVLIKKAKIFNDTLQFLMIQYDISHVFIEDFLMGYTFGRTSKKTIIALAQFQGMCRLMIELSGLQCQAISVATARKLVIGKIKKTKEQSQKDFVYEWFKLNIDPTIPDLKNSKDMVDAWVISKSGWKLLMQQK